ncbi:hypothetical protein C8J34_106279 [Rhizobium sp. PP-F2F-G36]|nr:hypothetical protein C8J34_106279 [Rhizobium sp. PP-F2F-G36]
MRAQADYALAAATMVTPLSGAQEVALGRLVSSISTLSLSNHPKILRMSFSPFLM